MAMTIDQLNEYVAKDLEASGFRAAVVDSLDDAEHCRQFVIRMDSNVTMEEIAGELKSYAKGKEFKMTPFSQIGRAPYTCLYATVISP